MNEVLYRKYRPKDFDGVVGHENFKQILLNELESDSLPHALLFNGQKGTGKTSVARIIAKVYNCKNNNQNKSISCDKCESCINFINDSHPDIIEIDAASNNGVDEIRGLKQNINISPIIGRHKIYIIDEVHMLTQSAFNAFLKTLEEPPSFVVFILATTEIHKIPQTILSRCQLYNFNKLSFLDIKEKIEEICIKEGREVDDECLSEIYYMCDGSLRDALNILDQLFAFLPDKVTIDQFKRVFSTISKKEKLNLILFILEKKYDEIFDFFNKIDNQNINNSVFILSLIDILKELIESKIVNNKKSFIYITNEDFNIFSKFNYNDILKVADIFILLYQKNKNNNLKPKIILITLIAKLLLISNNIIDKSMGVIDSHSESIDQLKFSIYDQEKNVKNKKNINTEYKLEKNDTINENDNVEIKKNITYKIKESAIFMCLNKSTKKYREEFTIALSRADFSKLNNISFLEKSKIIAATKDCLLYATKSGENEMLINYKDLISNEETIKQIKNLFGSKIAIIQIEQNKVQLIKIKYDIDKDRYNSSNFSLTDFYEGKYFDSNDNHDEKLGKIIGLFGKDNVKID
ncbi:DNA polymerase III subunit gamma/tau [Spiroplasma endosymbiont of Aspidapion aeneum]|uniref:DNA polymerase III subunit gamma/tau n=1 Tax=Spiroplasma endosymbiont of Aspidapion aeneum TaxID=3066276 RepID=UPI00313BF4D0